MDKSNPLNWDPHNLKGMVEAVSKDNEQKFLEIASLHVKVFNSPEGKKLLEYWERSTLDKPVVWPNSTQFGAGIREGENKFVRTIKDNIRWFDDYHSKGDKK